MKAIIESMLEEIGAMHSGHFVPYHKTAIVVAAVVAFLFSVVFHHATVFEGQIAVIQPMARFWATSQSSPSF